LSIPIAVLWLIGVSNAFNLVDGLAGGVGVVALISILASKYIISGATVPIYSLALAGALLAMVLHGLHWLQYHEFIEVGSSITSAALTGRTVIRDKIHARDVAALIRQATTFEQVGEILEAHAERCRFVHAELQGRSEVRQYAEPLQVQMHGGCTWKLEYPVLRPDSEITYPIMLSIWTSTETVGTSLSAERVTKILAPAIREWLAATSRSANTSQCGTSATSGDRRSWNDEALVTACHEGLVSFACTLPLETITSPASPAPSPPPPPSPP
jgi:hypothetical protein